MEQQGTSTGQRGLAELPIPIMEEVIRQFRSARNDILRYGVWNIKNLTDEDFNHYDDRKLFNFFCQDLLETRFVDRGRRIDIIQTWQFFDHQLSGVEPLLIDKKEVFLNVEDKDLNKVRQRIGELQSFMSTLRSDDLDSFKRVKYKIRRTVMRLTYDIHHLNKRLEKYRKQRGIGFSRTDGSQGAETDTAEPHTDDSDEP